ncbi:MAG: hypothetical protein QOG03_1989 [Actinomycetota bacterium]|jgi:hypothetical protein|nr:hypothetical protein [Actinomycetota bacterium]
MSSPLSRRTFLAGTAVLAAAAACGKGKPKVIDTTTDSTTSAANALNLIVATFDPVAGLDQRLAFAVLKDQEPLPKSEAQVMIELVAQGGGYGPPAPAVRHDDGIEHRPFWELTTKFTKPGVWQARVQHGGETATAAFEVLDPAAVSAPIPGRALLSTPTPTLAATQGVTPICTRQPACPWHTVSLDQALRASKPVVVLFGTPARCESQTCGPVLDILLGEKDAFEAKGVQFIHVEIYKDLQTQVHVPAVDAYKLSGDPVLFTAGANGVVVERVNGPFDRADAKAFLGKLVA